MAYIKTNWTNDVTPANATNMNKIEQGIEDLQKHIITATASSDGAFAATTSGARTMQEELKIGTKLSVSSGYIVIGAGVTKIKICGQLYLKNDTATSVGVNLYIARDRGGNVTNLYNARTQIAGSMYGTIAAPTKIISVQEGDKFQIRWWKSTTTSITLYGGANSFITAEVVE